MWRGRVLSLRVQKKPTSAAQQPSSLLMLKLIHLSPRLFVSAGEKKLGTSFSLPNLSASWRRNSSTGRVFFRFPAHGHFTYVQRFTWRERWPQLRNQMDYLGFFSPRLVTVAKDLVFFEIHSFASYGFALCLKLGLFTTFWGEHFPSSRLRCNAT